MANETGKILFTREGMDANGNRFRHDLVYSRTKGKEQVFVISVGMDLDGVPFREEWEHSESADAIVQILTGNDYLSLTRVEFEREVFPTLALSSPALAKEVIDLIDDESDFCGDL
jgi:hypothetical protein